MCQGWCVSHSRVKFHPHSVESPKDSMEIPENLPLGSTRCPAVGLPRAPAKLELWKCQSIALLFSRCATGSWPKSIPLPLHSLHCVGFVHLGVASSPVTPHCRKWERQALESFPPRFFRPRSTAVSRSSRRRKPHGGRQGPVFRWSPSEP